MAKSLVSIITPTYNHEHFIGQCIESVLGQTYDTWEMIIVDDGSTDRTPEIASSYKDSRIRYFHQQNKGIWRLSETYNSALEQASGKFIAILEGDDLWPRNKLEIQVPLLESGDSVLCYGRFFRIDEDGRLLSKSESFSSEIIKQSGTEVIRRLLKGGINVLPATVLINRQYLERVGGFQQPSYYPAVEHPTWLTLALQGPFCYVKAVMGYWRRHIGQANDLLGMQLSEGRLRCNIDFIEGLDEKICKDIGVSKEQISKQHKKAIATAYFRQGRYRLIIGNHVEARRLFISALQGGTVFTKIQALLGIMALKLGIDLEDIIALVGRERYRLKK